MNFFKLIKRKILNRFHLEWNYLYDYFRFKRFFSSSSNKEKDKKNLQAWILKDSHRIEKGLSLPEPRYSFGEQVLRPLVLHLVEYADKYGKDKIYFLGTGTLNAYEKFHLTNSEKLPIFFNELKQMFNSLDLENEICDDVGIKEIVAVGEKYKNFFEEFVSSRRSCRNFNNQKRINNSTLKSLVKLSIESPSVCNRQHWHVHFFNGELKNKVLAFQNGNTGFTDNIPYVAIVTSDLRSFYTEHERNQPFIDGGIFSMSLMYAMHSMGIGSCPLNWCNSFTTDREFRKLGYIKASETIIMLIAFGYPNTQCNYAKSPRMSVSDFYTINDIN